MIHLNVELRDPEGLFPAGSAWDYERAENKPKINGVELVGDVELTGYATEAYVDGAIDGALGVIVNASY